MSSLTNFLKLFKWDPQTDGSQKFNIDKALNDNIDKIDTYLENLEIGGRNLLLDSKREITNSVYEMASYNLAEVPEDNQEYTMSLKGQLGNGKNYFWIYNTYTKELTSLKYDEIKKIYKSTFKWKSGTGSNANTKLIIYTYPNSVTATSSIEWVKLEKGNKATDWTPAPEDKANLSDLDTKMNLHRYTKELTAKGWYRVAEFVNTGIYIVNIAQKYNNNVDCECFLTVTINSKKFNISILDSEFYKNDTLGISQARLVKDTNTMHASTFLEIYYNYDTSNDISIQVINETVDANSFNMINFTETTSEDIFVKVTKDMRILHLDDAILALQQQKITTGTEFATNEWIDNKQVYRKRINIGALPNASSKEINTGLSNVKFVRFEGIIFDSDYNTMMPLPYVASYLAGQIYFYTTNYGAKFVITAGDNRSGFSAYIDLYYTKN